MKRILFLVLITLMASCKAQQNSSTPTASITGIKWTLTKMGDHNLAIDTPVTLLLDESRKSINGHGGCNGYFGGYQLNGVTISFTGIGSTKMFCQDKQAIEDSYFKALSTIQSFKAEGNKLYLLQEGKVILEFSKN